MNQLPPRSAGMTSQQVDRDGTGDEPGDAPIDVLGATDASGSDRQRVPGLTELESTTLDWLQGFASAKTRNGYASDLGLRVSLRGWPGAPMSPTLLPLAFLPWCQRQGIDPLTGLTKRAFLAWLHALSADGQSNTTRRRRYITVCSWYRHLRGEGLTSINPRDMVNTRTMKLTGSGGSESPTRPLTVGQIRALFTAVRLDGTAHRLRNLAILGVLSASGCRAEELVELDLHHYWRESPGGPGKVHLHGKGDKWRTQTLPAYECELVDAYLEVRVSATTSTDIARLGQLSNRKDRHPLFTTRHGERLHVDTIQPMLNRVAALPTEDHSSQYVRRAHAELRPIVGTIHPHQFRHSYAATAERNGKPVTVIRDNLGHNTLATTQLYLASANEGESAAQVVSDIYHAGESLTLLQDTAAGHSEDTTTERT